MDLYKLARRRFHSMYSRCYRDESKYAERRAYSDCEICFEWLNYTNYTDWFICNWYEVKSGSQMQVDKDIISPGNREYSPETCIIVPSYVNTYFTGSVNNTTAGVYKYKECKKYTARSKEFNGTKTSYLGIYDTAEEAHKAWADYKNKQLQEQVIPYFINDINAEDLNHPMVIKAIEALRRFRFE